MKKLKYLIIIIICIAIFMGIGLLKKDDYIETDNKEVSEIKKENLETIKIQSGEELIQKAEKILSARGWAGASNNVIGLKNGIIYYYNKGTNEFYEIAEGIKDIYYLTEYSEEITAEKNNTFKEIKDAPEFLVYK